MSHSYGEGYATRSDEEGFGGTYGGNQTLEKDNEIHENHPGNQYLIIISLFLKILINHFE